MLIASGVLVVAVDLSLLAAVGLGVVINVAAWGLRILARAEVKGWTTGWLSKAKAWFPQVRIAVVLIAAALLVALWINNNVSVLAYSACVFGYMAAGAALNAWRRSGARSPRWGWILLAGATTVGLVSLVVATVNVSTSWFFGVLAAVLVYPIGLALVAHDLAKDTARLKGQLPVAWAAAAVAAGVAGLNLTGIGSYQALGVTIVLVATVAAICSNTSHDIVLVLLAVTLFWSLDPLIGDEQPDPDSGDAIIALGDSYMSGEGANVFYKDTNHNHGDANRNECRRSPVAYPVRLQQQLAQELLKDEGYQLLFLACSGAKGNQLTTDPQYRGEPITPWTNRGAERSPEEIDEQEGQAQLPQALEAIKELKLTPKIVLVSIGGNDSAFGEIGQTCGLAGDCSVMGELWMSSLEGSRTKIDAAYTKIDEALDDFTPHPRVIVVPYPIPLNESGCTASLLRPNEHRFLVGYTRALDRVLEEEADEVGFEFLASGVDAFTRERVRICDESPSKVGVNQLAASPVSGVFLQQVSPRQWFHNTFHPNEVGHEVIAKLLADHIHNPEVEEATSTEAPLTLEGIMGDGFDHCASSTRVPPTCHVERSAWMTAAMARLLWALLIPVLLSLWGPCSCRSP